MKQHECEHCERSIIYECDSFTLEAVRLHNVWKLYKIYKERVDGEKRVC
jgi:hypothetical protein